MLNIKFAEIVFLRYKLQTGTLTLNRNLRKNLLQGSPWVYAEALIKNKDLKTTGLCKLKDSRNSFVCWGMYDPQSPLAFRVLSLDEKPPTKVFYEQLILQAIETRKNIGLQNTNCFRLINGEGDFLPGFICDIYNNIAVIQFDGQGPYDFWDQNWIAEILIKNTDCEAVYYKPRYSSSNKPLIWGKEDLIDSLSEVLENDVKFYVDIIQGQKTGFFLDQRENRSYVKKLSKSKSVMNLFSYSGGFSVYAGLGGATKVTSVDIAQGALELAEKNWLLNNLEPKQHRSICADVFDFIHTTEDKYDIVICDPPSLAKSEKHKDQALQKYIETFAAAAKKVLPKGHLILSSCSSHISFNDFNEIATSALSKARKRGQILRVSGQGPDHPYPHACPELRYLKFMDIITY